MALAANHRSRQHILLADRQDLLSHDRRRSHQHVSSVVPSPPGHPLLAGPSRAAEIIGEARASLLHPTRPQTPAHRERGRDLRMCAAPLSLPLKPAYQRSFPLHTQSLTPLPRRLDPLLTSESLANAQKNASHLRSSPPISPGNESRGLQYFPTPSPSPAPGAVAAALGPHRAAVRTTPENAEQQWEALLLSMSLMINEGDSSLLAERVDSFRNNLEAEGWLRSGGSKQQDRMRRERVMQDIIRWMDGAPNADVAIAGCSIVLKLSKSEKVLRHTCKLLFKLSLNEDNDSVFQKYHAFESLVDFIRELGGKTPPCTKHFMASLCPLLTHAAGTIKNLTHSDANARAIAELHASKYLARMIATVLNIDMRSLSDDSFLSAVQLLTQITEALRNLLTTSSATTLFLQPIFDGKDSELVVEVLVRTLQPKSGLCDSVDVVSNICRTLSKLSLEPRCLPYLGGPENIHSFVEVLLKYQSEKKNPQSLIVRICFILGNLTTSLSADHVYLRAGIADLVSLLSVYLSVELGGESDEDVDQTSDVGVVGARDNEEVLVKLIRLLANIAIDPEAGETLVQMVELEELVQLFACKSIAEHEELVLNIVGAFANFTFYDFEQNCLLGMRLEIAKGMVSLLLNPNAETVVEAGRVLANLSRHADVRRLMAERRGTEVLTVLLDHLDRNVIYQASGCLTNLLLCGSPTTGSGPPDPHAFIILQNDGMKKLINVMYEACQDEDFELAAIAAKALHNLCSSSYRRMMTPDDIDQLQSLVAEILDSGADCVDASDISDNKLELLEVADSLDTALVRMYKDNGTSRGAGADRADGSPVELEEWDCERG